MNLRWKLAQNFEILWWRRYLKRKPVQSYLDWKKSYWQTFLERLKIEVSISESILDVGCGPAGIFIILSNENLDAVDPLLNEYESNLEHFDRKKYPNVNFIHAPFENFETEKKYDKIFCLNAVNHVRDLKKCIQKLSDLLTENGTLILSVDAHNYLIFKYLFRFLPGDILHPHQYDLTEYIEMTSESGLAVQKTILYKKEFFFDYHIIIAQMEIQG